VYDERTCEWRLALLIAALYPQVPDAHFVFAKIGGLKTTTAAETKSYTQTRLVVEPEFPWQLDSAMLEYPYPEDDRPVSVHMPGARAVAANATSEKSSRLLKPAR